VRRLAAVAALAALVLSLAACTPDRGTVYDKKTTVVKTCVRHDKDIERRTGKTCVQDMDVTHWYVCIEGDKPGNDGKKPRGCAEVTKDDYDKARIGDRYH
jgi:hypothetical protein